MRLGWIGALILGLAIPLAGCAAAASGTPPSSIAPDITSSPTPVPASPNPGMSSPEAMSRPSSSVGPGEWLEILSGPARTTLKLTSATGFTANANGASTCGSAPLGTDVVTITGLDLGSLHGARIRATVSLTNSPTDGNLRAAIELWIDSAFIPEGTTQPFWHGAARLPAMALAAMSGRAVFAAAALEVDAKMPAPVGWPKKLSGELDWSCDQLSSPDSPVSISVDDVRVTMRGSIVAAVRLRATVHAIREAHMDLGDKIPDPAFGLRAPGGLVAGAAASSGPSAFAAGSDTVYELTFEVPLASIAPVDGIVLASTYLPAAPGTWVLVMSVIDEGGAAYTIEVSVVVAASPSA